MIITIRINGKKISMKKAVEEHGKEKMEQRVKEAIESHYADPLERCSWADGMSIAVATN